MNSTLAANPLQNVRNFQNKCLKNDFTSDNTLSSPSAPHLHHPHAPVTKMLSIYKIYNSIWTSPEDVFHRKERKNFTRCTDRKWHLHILLIWFESLNLSIVVNLQHATTKKSLRTKWETLKARAQTIGQSDVEMHLVTLLSRWGSNQTLNNYHQRENKSGVCCLCWWPQPAGSLGSKQWSRRSSPSRLFRRRSWLSRSRSNMSNRTQYQLPWIRLQQSVPPRLGWSPSSSDYEDSGHW